MICSKPRNCICLQWNTNIDTFRNLRVRRGLQPPQYNKEDPVPRLDPNQGDNIPFPPKAVTWNQARGKAVVPAGKFPGGGQPPMPRMRPGTSQHAYAAGYNNQDAPPWKPSYVTCTTQPKLHHTTQVPLEEWEGKDHAGWSFKDMLHRKRVSVTRTICTYKQRYIYSTPARTHRFARILSSVSSTPPCFL